MSFADVLIEHPYSRKQESFTYEVPTDWVLKRGDGVAVPFQRTQKAGIVLRVHEEKPSFSTKQISTLLREEFHLKEWQLSLADWISDYYFCSKYDAIKLFLPKGIFKKRKPKKQDLNKKDIQKNSTERHLTDQQAHVVKTILQKKPQTSLIQGVTGAGKTEIYIHLIKNCIQKEAQALVLVPEISLTPQVLKHFQKHFPRIALIHSRVTEANRAELWKKIHQGEIDVVLGSRSALFSPFKKLGLIVMDEEHEWSYKQDQNPRYHARTLALKMSALTGAPLILGSATPSVESRYAADQEAYAFFELKERISGTALPEVQVVDMRQELKGGNFSMLSTLLEQKISSALAAKEQVILFLNRRGSASSTVCRDCGFTSKCPDCDLPLTYHAKNFRTPSLVCHHCGRIEKAPELCPHCHSTRIKQLGLGTEKVEAHLQKLFPLAKIARADKDTMSKKNSYENLHEQLNNGDIDILIGTQMIGKGFDIAKVSLVGILMADLGLHIPDFRTTERMFQLLTQVAGRAGRREKQGQVILQTYNPEHPAITFSTHHDYNGFYEQEINSRREANLPPFSKLVKLMLVGKTQTELQTVASFLQTQLQNPDHILYSSAALFPPAKGKVQWNLLLQGPNPLQLIKNLAPESLKLCRIDVDPLISV